MRAWHRVVLAMVTIAGCDSPQSGNPKTNNNNNSGGSSSSGSSGSGGNSNSANGSNCSPSSPGALFADALCLCGSLHDIGNLVVDGNGPGTSSSVGVDGVSRMINHTDVGGSYSAWGGMSDAGYTAIHQDLLSPMDIDVAGNLEISRDLAVGGNLSGLGRVAVGGVLRVAGADDMIGFQQVGQRGAFSALGSAPCPCDAGSILDVAAAVAAARSASSTVILSSSPSGTIGINDLVLATGNYYLATSATIGLERLHVTGAAALYVDGTIDEIGADRLIIDSGATLDLYVSAGVNTVGYAGIGDAASPSSFRLYVGGAAPVTLSVGAQWFHGSIYAPRANIVYVGDTHVAGGLFANELVGAGQLVIGGSLPGAPGGGTCPAPAPGPSFTPSPPIK